MAFGPEIYEVWRKRNVLNPEDEEMKTVQFQVPSPTLTFAYSAEQLADFEACRDAPLNDIEIITTKAEKLCLRDKPISLLNILKQKSKCKIKPSQSQSKNAADGTIDWTVQIKIDDAQVGQGSSKTIKEAENLAALDMFKRLFPAGTTWNGAIKLVREHADPLGYLASQSE